MVKFLNLEALSNDGRSKFHVVRPQRRITVRPRFRLGACAPKIFNHACIFEN